ncbi:MAG: C1 family peptidase [Elusimicrobiota bacterium]
MKRSAYVLSVAVAAAILGLSGGASAAEFGALALKDYSAAAELIPAVSPAFVKNQPSTFPAPAGSGATHAFATGYRPPTPEESEYLKGKLQRIESVPGNVYAMLRRTRAPGENPGLPSAVKNWEYLPKVGNQGRQGSCSAWAACYYYKTYQEAKEHGWRRPSPDSDPEHVMSPAFCYNIANKQSNEGSALSMVMRNIADYGSATWKDMPYSQGDYKVWPSEQAWRNAIQYRARKVGYIEIGTDKGINDLKQNLANGDLAVVALNVGSNFEEYPCRGFCEGVDKRVLYRPSGETSGHALTVIGYDDTITYNEDGRPGRGAFLLVNSWGTDYGIKDPDVGTGGFIWVSYSYVRDNAADPNAYVMVDREAYQPTAFATVGVSHPKDACLNISIQGGNSKDAPEWNFNPWYLTCRNRLKDARVVLDISDYELSPSKSVWLKVYNADVYNEHGTITFAGVQRAGEAARAASGVPLETVPGSDVYLEISPPPPDSNRSR